MTAAIYNSTELQNLVGSFNGGLAGAPVMLRASQRAKMKAINFTYSNGSGNTNVAGDRVIVARLFPTDYFLDWVMNVSVILPSANLLVNWGKIDTNSGVATNAAFDSAIPVQVVGVYRAGIFPINATNVGGTTTSNLPLQVGSDPAGDLSNATNDPPNFGSGLINIFFQMYNGTGNGNTIYTGFIVIGSGQ